MNAYTQPQSTEPDAAETAAKHKRMLCRLAELGMSLAEIAAEDIAAADTAIDLEPGLAPGTAGYLTPEAAPQPQAERPRRHTRPELILSFTRLSRIVTHAISLHAALQAGAIRPPQGRAAKPPPEPELQPDARRFFLQPALAEIAELNPHLEISLPEAHRALEIHLADPERGADKLCTLLARVCADLGLPPEAQPHDLTQNLFNTLDEDLPPDHPDG